MKIIDAHAHVFEILSGFGARGELRAIGKGKARWANGDEISMIPDGYGDKNFTAESLIKLMDENNIEKSILLQGSFYGFHNHYVMDSQRKYPERFLAAGTLDPFCKRSMEILKYALYEQKFSAMKFELSSGGGLMSYHDDFCMDNDNLSLIFSEINNAGVTLVLDLGSPKMPSFQPLVLSQIAKRNPNMKIVICHMLAPTLNDYIPLKDSLNLIKVPNVWVDLAAVPWNISPEKYPYETGARFVRLAADILGTDKLIWGSDVPSTLTRESYVGQIEFITKSGLFSEKELSDIFYNNAFAAYAL